MASYTAVGLMSGSSLDGLDMCCVQFKRDAKNDMWDHSIVSATTVPYSPSWRERLRAAEGLAGRDLIKLDVEYAHYLGQAVNTFIRDQEVRVDLVASHGHTIFHQPQHGFTCQIGDGETLVTHLSVPLVSNFRNKDVALGGQGAPLVPGGEKFLFKQFDFCLNLGGICNISYEGQGFDISICNMALNYLAITSDFELEFDVDGKIAAKGKVQPELLKTLNDLEFYRLEPPKSLGKEWFDQSFRELLDTDRYTCADLMRTCVVHISQQIAASLKHLLMRNISIATRMLVTGGGALNPVLMSSIIHTITEYGLNVAVETIDEDTINYKEALVFAFLGLRTLLGLPNVYTKVTGASNDSVSGSIHLPPDSEFNLLKY